MIRTIPRYGVRAVSGSSGAALQAIAAGEGVEGKEIAQFERAFAAYHGTPHAVSASYGRMAFYYILRSLDLEPGAEIVFPALTFWVVPEIAKNCGLRPVFADIDARTFNLDPACLERAITPKTRVVVPTHLYGQPCDMKAIVDIASRHRLLVIEDCAHALGATYKGLKTGTFGDAAFFSFQMLKGLNTYGGGMAITRNDAIAERVRRLSRLEPPPTTADVTRKILLGEIQRGLIDPYGFTFSMYIPFYIASLFGNHDLSRYLWEKIRPLSPLPQNYRRRFSNAQAIVGLRGLAALDRLNEESRSHAKQLSDQLAGVKSIATPYTLPGTNPVYYQYCIQASDPAALSRRAIRHGVDMEIMHVDICNKLALFRESAAHCPVAESTEGTLQLPVYSALRKDDVERVIRVVRNSAKDLPALPSARPAILESIG